MLTKETKIDKIEIIENGIIQVRKKTLIYEDGNELSFSYERSSFEPGQDVSTQDQKIQDICIVVWTKEIISAYKAQQD